MADDHHSGGACCGACGFAAAVSEGRVAPHRPGEALRVVLDGGVPRGVTLVVIAQDRSVTRIPVATPVVRIGRTRDNEVVVADGRVSRRQCVLTFSEGVPTLRDGQSGCGTFVNGEKIRQHALRHGDRIYIADVTLRVEIAHQEP